MILTEVEAREARILREYLTYGLGGLDAVERWADPIAARTSELPFPLIQLGLARANGAEACNQAFEALGIGAISPKEMVNVLAEADFERLSLEQLQAYFLDLWQRAVGFIGGAPQDIEAVWLLMDASDLELAARAARSGQTTLASVREMVPRYAMRARELLGRAGGAP